MQLRIACLVNELHLLVAHNMYRLINDIPQLINGINWLIKSSIVIAYLWHNCYCPPIRPNVGKQSSHDSQTIPWADVALSRVLGTSPKQSSMNNLEYSSTRSIKYFISNGFHNLLMIYSLIMKVLINQDLNS